MSELLYINLHVTMHRFSNSVVFKQVFCTIPETILHVLTLNFRKPMATLNKGNAPVK